MLNLLFIIFLLIIFWQDIKERSVTLLLFPILIVLGGSIHYQNSSPYVFLYALIINCGFSLLLLGILYGYSKFKMRKNLSDTFGAGDFLFFIVFAVSFPTVTFLVLFSTSLIFSLFVFLVLKPYLEHKTVPLAGLQALFLSLVVLLNFLFNFAELYAV